ncbi:MAG: hypothetical protein CVU39_09985 [Chloroflexi bacterium HGW-Chloroflexi-10]|nr:MAG: hypothetical protein CVU39_09985 [Chloroflexi bacterium HGW-Chloroflexi-10]
MAFREGVGGGLIRRNGIWETGNLQTGETHFGKRGGSDQEKRDLANRAGLIRRNALFRLTAGLFAGRACQKERLLGVKVHLSYWRF